MGILLNALTVLLNFEGSSNQIYETRFVNCR